MKKTILFLFAAISFACSANAQLSIAPELGVNMANMTLKNATGTKSTSLKPGLTAGGIAELTFTDRIFLQPGLFYLMNGFKNSVGKGSVTVHTVQIPVNVEYKIGNPDGTRFFVGAGPFIGFNIGGNIVDSNDTKTSLAVSSDSGAYNIRLLDVGAGVHVGILLSNNFYARVRYQMGFTNLEPRNNAGLTATSYSIGITVGYYFKVGKQYKKHGPLKYDK